MDTTLQPPPRPHADLDSVNRPTWARPATVRIYERMRGWTDAGEEAAVHRIAQEMRGKPMLDIGVGGGRTTELLLPITPDYIGVDYTPEMVQACRMRHPGMRIEQMDARDLGAFADGQFALVMFSFNGIDAVDMAGRVQVLREVHRVLQPDGVFLFSTHNQSGPGLHERPRLHVPFSWNPARLGWRVLKMARGLPLALANYWRYKQLDETHEDWAVANAAAHDFGMVIGYTTLAGQKRQLQEAGFRCEAVFDSTRGQVVADDADTRDMWWFHYVARKA
jgi:SAM-dependent methyltransferase